MHHAIYLTQRASPTTRARASSATRPKTRLHPYAQSSCLSPPHSSFLITPASSVSPSPLPSTTLHGLERPRHHPPPSAISQPLKNAPPRDAHKSRYVIGLIDQAVKSLCDIWPPNHIPEVFCTSSRVTIAPSKEPSSSVKQEVQRLRNRNTQLPSPISPGSESSPTSPPGSRSSSVVGNAKDCPHGSDQDVQSNLVPLRGFVHEVLRRSRTSGNVLQTALCYLEAIRSKVPELVRQEESGEAVHGETDSGDRITKAEDMSVPFDDIINTDNCASEKQTEDGMATVLCTDISNDPMDVFATSFSNPQPPTRQNSDDEVDILSKKHNKSPSPPLPPLPPLPSPLLCPRRAFLAALILASKFTQDRCYSNKAWAKLSGLPPREIGRCERALGDALDWRLWVGKTPTPLPTSNQARNTRSVVRSRSEGDLFPRAKEAGSSKNGVKSLRRKETELFGHPRDWGMPGQPFNGTRDSLSVGVLSNGGQALVSSSRALATLRRSATLPAEAFDIEDSSIPVPEPDSESNPSLEAPGSDMQMVYEQTSVSDTVESQSSNSLSPSTPPLSFSPSSTESTSDGDRTIQMSSFIDISTPPPLNGCLSVGHQKGAVLPALVDSYGCGYSPTDPVSGTYPRRLSYYGVTASYQSPVDITHLYTY